MPPHVRADVSPELARALTACRHRPHTCAVHAISRASRAILALYDRALAPTGLTAAQLDVLLTLAEVGPSNMKALAGHVGADASTMPRLLERLARTKLVQIGAGTDRRHRIARLTNAGARRIARALPVWDAVQEQFVSNFGKRRWNRARRDLDRMVQGAKDRR